MTRSFQWCLPLSLVRGPRMAMRRRPPLGLAGVFAITGARGASWGFLSVIVMAAPLLVVRPGLIPAVLTKVPALPRLLLNE